jgi:hypothetical protein
MRGQAFVVFEEISAATAAMRALVGEEFYGRPLVSAGFEVHSWRASTMGVGCMESACWSERSLDIGNAVNSRA